MRGASPCSRARATCRVETLWTTHCSCIESNCAFNACSNDSHAIFTCTGLPHAPTNYTATTTGASVDAAEEPTAPDDVPVRSESCWVCNVFTHLPHDNNNTAATTTPITR
eukprot:PhM_4_TR18748/c0_g1_i1/m.1540